MTSVFGIEPFSVKVELLIFNLFFFSVGNIPYGVSEEQLKDIFSGVGPVVSFRYVKLGIVYEF